MRGAWREAGAGDQRAQVSSAQSHAQSKHRTPLRVAECAVRQHGIELIEHGLQVPHANLVSDIHHAIGIRKVSRAGDVFVINAWKRVAKFVWNCPKFMTGAGRIDRRVAVEIGTIEVDLHISSIDVTDVSGWCAPGGQLPHGDVPVRLRQHPAYVEIDRYRREMPRKG